MNIQEHKIKFYKQKETHRKEIREYLPPELQLEFSQKRVEKDKWSFGGTLSKLRRSKEPEDRLFIETLRMQVKSKEQVKTQDFKKLKELQTLAQTKKEKIAESINIMLLYEQGIKGDDPYVRRGTAKSLGELAKVDPEKYISLYEQGIKGDDPYVRRGTARTLGALAKVDPKKAIPLYEQGIKDDDPLVRRGTAESLGELAKVDQEKYISLYEQGIKDKDPGVAHGTARTLGALAKVDPEKYISLYEQGIKDDDSYVRYGIAESLGELAKYIDEDLVSRFDKIFVKLGTPRDYTLYASYIVVHLLKNDIDLGKFSLDYWSNFQTIKKYSQDVNQNLRQEKRTDNIEDFFKKHQINIAKLQTIDFNTATSFITSYAKNYGFPRLERFFKNVVTSLDAAPLMHIWPNIKNIDPGTFSSLIEIFSAYQRMGLSSKLDEILPHKAGERVSAQDLIKNLGKDLLKSFSKKINIKAKVAEDAFDKWNLHYLPRLFTAEAQYEEEDRELLRLIMKISFQEPEFLPVLFGRHSEAYNRDEKEWLDEIEKYNLLVKKEFEDNGLDFNQWLEYSEKKEFDIGASPDQLRIKKQSFEKELIENIKALIGSFKEKKQGLLPPEYAKQIFNSVIKKYGIQFREQGIWHIQKGKFSIKDIGLIIKDFNNLVQGYLNQEQDEEKKSAVATVLDHLKTLEQQVPDLEKSLNRKGYSLSIQVWDREPGYDIFQGNYTHCCVAVENFNRGAILDYMVDTGLQVVEIKDKAEDRTIAQTWLWIAKDSQNRLNLVLDNIEINSDYVGLKDQIKKNLFEYLYNYTQSFSKGKIKRIVLGTAYNDIDTDDLGSISLSFTKLGGSPRETEYLDASGSNWVDPRRETTKTLFEVADLTEFKKFESQKVKKPLIKIIKKPENRVLKQIQQVEIACFPEQMQSSFEDLQQTFKDKNGIHMIVQKHDKVVGYLSSLPQKNAFKELKEWDPNFLKSKNTLYVESVAIEPGSRDIKLLFSLLRELKEQAKKKGYDKISMHAQVQNGLSRLLQRKGAKFVRRLENWHNFGEVFDYLELDIID